MEIRYYFHGDLAEDGLYYCALCDTFEHRDHFFDSKSPHSDHEKGLKRYRRDVKNWRLTKKGTQFYRPKTAVNIYA